MVQNGQIKEIVIRSLALRAHVMMARSTVTSCHSLNNRRPRKQFVLDLCTKPLKPCDAKPFLAAHFSSSLLLHDFRKVSPIKSDESTSAPSGNVPSSRAHNLARFLVVPCPRCARPVCLVLLLKTLDETPTLARKHSTDPVCDLRFGRGRTTSSLMSTRLLHFMRCLFYHDL